MKPALYYAIGYFIAFLAFCLYLYFSLQKKERKKEYIRTRGVEEYIYSKIVYAFAVFVIILAIVYYTQPSK